MKRIILLTLSISSPLAAMDLGKACAVFQKAILQCWKQRNAKKRETIETAVTDPIAHYDSSGKVTLDIGIEKEK